MYDRWARALLCVIKLVNVHAHKQFHFGRDSFSLLDFGNIPITKHVASDLEDCGGVTRPDRGAQGPMSFHCPHEPRGLWHRPGSRACGFVSGGPSSGRSPFPAPRPGPTSLLCILESGLPGMGMSGTCSFLMSPHADAQALPGRPLGHPIAPGYPRADRDCYWVLLAF